MQSYIHIGDYPLRNEVAIKLKAKRLNTETPQSAYDVCQPYQQTQYNEQITESKRKTELVNFKQFVETLHGAAKDR